MKYKVISVHDGVQYSGGGVYCAFGVCYDEHQNQRYFCGTFTSQDFSEILLYSEYPYELCGDCYPSFIPRENADDILQDELTESFRDFYDFWKQIFSFCDWYKQNPVSVVETWRENLERFKAEHLKFSRIEAEQELVDYVSAFPGTHGIVLYNQFLMEIGEGKHRFYDLNKDDFERMLRDNGMTVLDAVTRVNCDFDRNCDWCYTDADGFINSTDFPEEVCAWDSFYSYILDDGHDLGDRFLADLLANCNWR